MKNDKGPLATGI